MGLTAVLVPKCFPLIFRNSSDFVSNRYDINLLKVSESRKEDSPTSFTMRILDLNFSKRNGRRKYGLISTDNFFNLGLEIIEGGKCVFDD